MAGDLLDKRSPCTNVSAALDHSAATHFQTIKNAAEIAMPAEAVATRT